MASTTALSTLKKVLEDNKFSGVKKQDDRTYDRAAIGGLEMLAEVRRWSFHVSDTTIQTIGPQTITLTTEVAAGDTTINADTEFASGDVGKFIEFNGQQQSYEIASVTDSNNVVLRFPYQGETITVLNTVIMHQRDYALPQHFNTMVEIIPEQGISIPHPVTPQALAFRHSRNAGTGTPTLYSITTELSGASNSNVSFLSLYQSPNSILQYYLMFHRVPGWFDATTGDWKATPTADTDIVDWPDEKIGILHKAILLALADESEVTSSFLQKAQSAYFRKLGSAMAQDEKDGSKRVLGRRRTSRGIHGTLDFITGSITAQ